MSIVDWEKNRKFKKIKKEFEIYSDFTSLYRSDPTHPNRESTERRFEEIKEELFKVDKDKANELMKKHKEKVDEHEKFIHGRARNFGI